MEATRLDKILADSGIATRSEARRLIKAGRVSVNGETVNRAELKANPNSDDIKLDGRCVGSKMVYIMLNKPHDVVTATEDREHRTVIDLLPEELRRRGVFPVGRLDKNTTGLLLLTNDGNFVHAVISPNHNVNKVYEVYVEGRLDEADSAAFKDGIELRDGTKCLSALLYVDENDHSHAEVTISEGKYHQVKRMFAARGKPVVFLKRLCIGGLHLDENLEPGKCRELTSKELKLVFGE